MTVLSSSGKPAPAPHSVTLCWWGDGRGGYGSMGNSYPYEICTSRIFCREILLTQILQHTNSIEYKIWIARVSAPNILTMEMRDSFKKIKILPLCSQYIYSLMQYVVNNRHLFTRNSEIYHIGTRQSINLFPPSTSLARVQKGPYCSGIKIYNYLPMKLKQLSNNQKSFRSALTHCGPVANLLALGF
jgi:hypothetical protein